MAYGSPASRAEGRKEGELQGDSWKSNRVTCLVVGVSSGGWGTTAVKGLATVACQFRLMETCSGTRVIFLGSCGFLS